MHASPRVKASAGRNVGETPGRTEALVSATPPSFSSSENAPMYPIVSGSAERAQGESEVTSPAAYSTPSEPGPRFCVAAPTAISA
eukprot:scaffold11670_cov30-Tisochrysis_lutea.AAC.1